MCVTSLMSCFPVLEYTIERLYLCHVNVAAAAVTDACETNRRMSIKNVSCSVHRENDRRYKYHD